MPIFNVNSTPFELGLEDWLRPAGLSARVAGPSGGMAFITRTVVPLSPDDPFDLDVQWNLSLFRRTAGGGLERAGQDILLRGDVFDDRMFGSTWTIVPQGNGGFDLVGLSFIDGREINFARFDAKGALLHSGAVADDAGLLERVTTVDLSFGGHDFTRGVTDFSAFGLVGEERIVSHLYTLDAGAERLTERAASPDDGRVRDILPLDSGDLLFHDPREVDEVLKGGTLATGVAAGGTGAGGTVPRFTFGPETRVAAADVDRSTSPDAPLAAGNVLVQALTTLDGRALLRIARPDETGDREVTIATGLGSQMRLKMTEVNGVGFAVWYVAQEFSNVIEDSEVILFDYEGDILARKTIGGVIGGGELGAPGAEVTGSLLGIDSLDRRGSDPLRLAVTWEALGENLPAPFFIARRDLKFDFFTLNPQIEQRGTRLADRLTGLAQDDHLRGLQGDDLITGAKGADTLEGSAGDDSLSGDAGDDLLNGGTGTDSLTGGAGRDILQGEAGDDLLSGGAGQDGLAGGTGADTLRGGGGADRLEGGGDADLLEGGGAADSLAGQAGDDTLRGGSGADRLEGGAGNDALEGDDGADILRGGDGADFLNGGAGDDRLFGGADDDNLLGAAGRDTLTGDKGADVALGGTEADLLRGGDGGDVLEGEAGADRLFGDDGNDALSGGAGRDTLTGGQGADTLSGGDGADRFVFAARADSNASFTDTITDFSSREGDRIDLRGIDAQGGRSGDQAFRFIGTADFDGRPGALRLETTRNGLRVEGDVNGDSHADLVIRVQFGALDLEALTAGDFLL